MSPFCALFVVCAVTSQELPPRQQADGEIHQPEEEKEEDSLTAMTYSKSKNMTAFLSKVSATAEPIKGTPIDQLDKRLALLKY